MIPDNLLIDVLGKRYRKGNLKEQLKNLDPVLLLKRMRNAQTSLSELRHRNADSETNKRQSMEEFVKQLPELWKLGEVRQLTGRKLRNLIPDGAS